MTGKSNHTRAKRGRMDNNIDRFARLIAIKKPTPSQSKAGRRHVAKIYLSLQAIEARRAIKGTLKDLQEAAD